LQKSCLKAWSGKKENVLRAQAVLLHRAELNGLAQKGKYKSELETEASAKVSSYQKQYAY